MHKQLVDRSGYFEIPYSQALKSSLKRQETFTMAQYFYIYGKSKVIISFLRWNQWCFAYEKQNTAVNYILQNAIISSGAVHYLDIRNPFDVANLYPFQKIIQPSVN